jgi:hypothetical protein
MPVVAVQPLGLDIANQHQLDLPRLVLETHAEQLADHAVAALAAHQPAGPDPLRHAGADQRGGYAGGVLDQPGRLGTPLHPAAELGQPLAQELLGSPLRDDQHAGVRASGVGCRPWCGSTSPTTRSRR